MNTFVLASTGNLNMLSAKEIARRNSDFVSKRNEIKLREIENRLGVSIASLRRDDRRWDVVKLRHSAMYLVYYCTNRPKTHVGLLFQRDHSTVINALNKVEEDAKNKLPYALRVKRILEELR